MTCSLMSMINRYNSRVRYSAAIDRTSKEANSSSDPTSLLFNYGTVYVPGAVNGTTFAVDEDKAAVINKYALHTFTNYTNPLAPVGRSFDPRPEVHQDNTTLTMIFVALNAVEYQNKVNDPLFNATVPVQGQLLDSQGGTGFREVYMANNLARALSCQEQYQFCYKLFTGKDECTTLGELPLSVWLGNLPPPPDIDFSAFPNANAMQKTILRLISSSAYAFNIGNVAIDLEAGSLENHDFERGLPDDQWLHELTRWQKQILSSLQVAMIDYSMGPAVRDTAYPMFLRPTLDSEKQLCGMQKMRKSGGVVNVNVFGLSFIIVFSVLVALLDIFTLKFMIFLSRFRAALGPRIDRWIQDGIWQLQRRAYEGEGYRGWTDLEAEIPLTNERNLKDLPILWVPGKSPGLANLDFGLRDPAINYAETFGSTSTLGIDRMKKNGTVRTVEMEPVRITENRGLGLVELFRR